MVALGGGCIFDTGELTEGSEKMLTDGMQFFLGGYAMVYSLRATAQEMRASQGGQQSTGRKLSDAAVMEASKAKLAAQAKASASAAAVQKSLATLAAAVPSTSPAPTAATEPTSESQASQLDRSTSSQVSLALGEADTSQRLNDSLNISTTLPVFAAKRDPAADSGPRESQELKITNDEMDRQLFGNDFKPTSNPPSQPQQPDRSQNYTPTPSQTNAISPSVVSGTEPSTSPLSAILAVSAEEPSEQLDKPTPTSTQAESRPQSPPDSKRSEPLSQPAAATPPSPPTEPSRPKSPTTSISSAMDVDKASSQPPQSPESAPSIRTTHSTQSTRSTQSPVSTPSITKVDDSPSSRGLRQAHVEETEIDDPTPIKLPPTTLSDLELQRLGQEAKARAEKEAAEMRTRANVSPSPSAPSDSVSASTSPRSLQSNESSQAKPASTTPTSSPASKAASSSDVTSPSPSRRVQFSIVPRSEPYVLAPTSQGAVFVNADDPSQPKIQPVETKKPLIFGPSPSKLEEPVEDNVVHSSNFAATSPPRNREKKKKYTRRFKPSGGSFNGPFPTRKQPDRAARHGELPHNSESDEERNRSNPSAIELALQRGEELEREFMDVDAIDLSKDEEDGEDSVDSNGTPAKRTYSRRSAIDASSPTAILSPTTVEVGRTPRTTRSAAAAIAARSPTPKRSTSRPQIIISPPKLAEPAPPIVLEDPLDPYIRPDGKVDWAAVLHRCIVLEPAKGLEFAAIITIAQTGEHEYDKEVPGSIMQVQARFKIDGARSFFRGILLSDPAVQAAAQGKPPPPTVTPQSPSAPPTGRALSFKDKENEVKSPEASFKAPAPKLPSDAPTTEEEATATLEQDGLRRRPRAAHSKQHENFDDNSDSEREELARKRALARAAASPARIKLKKRLEKERRRLQKQMEDELPDRTEESQELEDYAVWCRWAGVKLTLKLPEAPDMHAFDVFAFAATALEARTNTALDDSAEDIALSTLTAMPGSFGRTMNSSQHFVNKGGPLQFNDNGRPSRKAKAKVTPEDLLDSLPLPRSRRRRAQAENAENASSSETASELPSADSTKTGFEINESDLLPSIEDERRALSSSASSAPSSKKRRATEDIEELETLPDAKKKVDAFEAAVAVLKTVESNFDIPIAAGQD